MTLSLEQKSGGAPRRPIQLAIVMLFVIAFLAIALLVVQAPHREVLWLGGILLCVTAAAARKRRPSQEPAFGMAVILFFGGPFVAIPVAVGENEGKDVALLAAGVAVGAASMLWAVTRCPSRTIQGRMSTLEALRQGLVTAYGIAAFLSLWALVGRRLYPNDISSVFLGWTVAGYFTAATIGGGLYPAWRHLLRFPLGALLAGGILGTVLYWSLVPAEVMQESGALSWTAVWADFRTAAVAGFLVGPLVLLHLTYKRPDMTGVVQRGEGSPSIQKGSHVG